MSNLSVHNTTVNPDIQDFPTFHKTITDTYDIVIVGGGVAGLTAGLYAARDGFRTLIMEGEMMSNVDYPGGALMLTPDIENYPGFTGAEGAELVGVIRAQAQKFGADIIEERAESITHSPDANIHIVHTENKAYNANAVILAMGATARLLGLAGEVEMYGRGVSTCATCDGSFFRDKHVVVVGGGDTAVEDALYLTQYVEKVSMVVRKDFLRASGKAAKEVLSNPKVNVLWNSEVVEITPSPEGQLSSVTLVTKNSSSNTNEVEELLALECSGMFVAIGRDPATGFLSGGKVALDEEGYVLAPNGDSTETNIPGIFAAGDVVDKVYRQAVTSAGKGAQAALQARHYILGR